MKKRVAATILWFYCAWYAGAMLAALLGVSPLIGPLLGLAAAAIVVGNPRQIIGPRDLHQASPDGERDSRATRLEQAFGSPPSDRA